MTAPPVLVLRTADAPPSLLTSLRHLLDAAFDGDFADEDWEHTTGGWHVVVAESSSPLAHAAVVERTITVGDRALRTGYVEGVATLPGRQRHGLGSVAMTEANALIKAEFELGALSTGRHPFYERLGWQRWTGPTFVRDGDRLLRTSDEDDGVMVLLFGHSMDVDRSAPIACEARTGDDW